MNQNERPLYYEGQYLGAEDLDAAVAYERVQLARHELGAHLWGIAAGLELRERKLPTGEVDVSVLPGIAWDGYGRCLVVTAPLKVTLDKFANQQADTPDEGLLVKVWLRYDEAMTRGPAPGFEACRDGGQYARAVEGCAIAVGEPPKGAHGTVSVAGRNLDPRKVPATFRPGAADLFDESVPYQEFPESGSKPQWWIPLGYVRWRKQAGKDGGLVPRNDAGSGGQPPDSDLIRAFRQYIGVVAEQIVAADGALRLRRRDRDPANAHFQPPQIAADPKNPPEKDLVWVEGGMRVFGDVRLAGGRLELREDNGVRDAVPQLVRRIGTNAQGGKDLQVIFASDDKPKGNNAFAVGVVHVDTATNDLKELTKHVVVRDDGRVGIGVGDPAAPVQIGTQTTLAEGPGGVTWSAFGNNAWYDGSWHQVKPAKPGVNLHMSADADGSEFRFLRVEPNDANRRNIAMLGTRTSYIREGLFGVGNASPAAQLHLKTLTVAEEGIGSEGPWANFGMNAFFDGTWKRVDNDKAGANLHINPDGSGMEFRFLKMEKDGTGQRNIAIIGTQTSYIGEGRLGVGTTAPQARLDVNGRILRKGADFSLTGTASHNSVIALPWGTTDDWNIFVSPRRMGREESDSEGDNALLVFECFADPLGSKTGFIVVARYKYKFANATDDNDGTWFIDGSVNWLLLPR